MARVPRIAAAIAVVASCGGETRPDYGPLDPVAASFGLACDMGTAGQTTCGARPNGCFSIATGPLVGDPRPHSALLFCARWCKDGCPSGTFCPNPEHAQMDTLFSGVCFRSCASDQDCAAGTVCDPSIGVGGAGGTGGCIPTCTSGHTVCDTSEGSVCQSNGHCSAPQSH
jgi:hypothetical protein